MIKKEGLFKRLKNIENAQNCLINSNNKNKPDSTRSKWSMSRVFDIVSSESKKTKMKMKMKKLHVNFIKMELRV